MKHPYKALKINGRRIDEHRYVVEVHLGRRLNRNECVHHKNGNKTDNRLENLEIVSRSDHAKHHYKRGELSLRVGGIPPIRKGEAHGKAVLNNKMIDSIRQMRDAGSTYRAIAEEMNCGASTVRDVLVGNTWVD